MKLSERDLRLILEKLNQLYLGGKVKTIEEAQRMAPTLDLKELIPEEEKKQKPPRHTKKKGQRY